MKLPQGWKEWPFSPGMFPDLLKLPEGELRRIAVAELKDRHARRHWISLVCWIVAAFLLVELSDLYHGEPGLQPDTPWRDVAFGILLTVVVAFTAVILPQLLTIKRLRRELAEMIAEGELWKCAECSYMLRGSTGDRCPECGEPIPDEIKQMIRPFAKRGVSD